ncbi:hypothetical protein A2Z22_00320 [Candidatus Woesebacteria bacterium RBG_16_34_12]|uniref:Uncharacterized protein n=1 Tax=Candidatus Woesebacteria bacterium RBG_16_34_12 TaxID=1802480 RepID=A0A1F7X8V2_9BACT|nr:MAG: hypothetical protein A2Z22_00320 [Candidatus Woesebacteria bacterium RBG_16_34_12]
MATQEISQEFIDETGPFDLAKEHCWGDADGAETLVNGMLKQKPLEEIMGSPDEDVFFDALCGILVNRGFLTEEQTNIMNRLTGKDILEET